MSKSLSTDQSWLDANFYWILHLMLLPYDHVNDEALNSTRQISNYWTFEIREQGFEYVKTNVKLQIFQNKVIATKVAKNSQLRIFAAKISFKFIKYRSIAVKRNQAIKSEQDTVKNGYILSIDHK